MPEKVRWGEVGDGEAGRPQSLDWHRLWCQELPLPMSVRVPLAEMGRTWPRKKEPGGAASIES